MQPMQIAAPGEYEAACFEDMPRNKGFWNMPLLWKLVERALVHGQ
jgi:hypothetical protein